MSTSLPIPKIEKSSIAYEGFYKIRIDLLSLPHVEEKLHYSTLMAAEEASVILAETEDGRLLINKEYRHPTGAWIYSLPGGRVDPDELPLAAAQRELREETGYEAPIWQYLGHAYPMPALCGQKIHYFYAKNAKFAGSPQKETLELIATLVMQEKELTSAVLTGAPTDGILLTALSLRNLARS